MDWLIWFLSALVSLIVVVLIIGWLLPTAHRATVCATFAQPADAAFATISNWQEFPSWRSGLKSVAARECESGRVSWIETGSQGTMPFEVMELRSPTRLVTKIADPKLPFGGTWTWEVVPESNGCRVTITEDGEIYNPIFRFVSRYVLGYEATMRGVLRDLGKHLEG